MPKPTTGSFNRGQSNEFGADVTVLAVCLLVFFFSAWACRATITLARRHQFGADENHGVQKSHSHWVPRLGGIPIFFGLVSGLLVIAFVTDRYLAETAFLIVCMLPAFAIGLVEDVTRQAGVTIRLVFTMIAAGLGWWLLDARIERVDVALIDVILELHWTAPFVMTLLAAGGAAHAINIIDGCHGLSAMVSSIAMGAVAIVAALVDDYFIMQVALIIIASLFGFLTQNFPRGRIFQGDSGAYLVGFLVALLSIMLVARNPEVSPWFPVLVLLYPVWETLFSIYRRAMVSKRHVGQPDALHLHQLIHRRVMRTYSRNCSAQDRVLQNALTSVYLWGYALSCAVLAVIFWADSGVLAGSSALAVMAYVLIYRKLVRFRTPRFIAPLGPGRSSRVRNPSGVAVDAHSELS